MKVAESKVKTGPDKVETPFFNKGESRSFFSTPLKGRSNFFGPNAIQPRLEIGSPDDEYEKEADQVADEVMRMPDPKAQRNPVEEVDQFRHKDFLAIQKQESGDRGTPLSLTLPRPSLLQPSIVPDFLAMRQPFIDRNTFYLWDLDSALHVWQFNLNFFKRFGLSPDWAAELANITAPHFIDAQLKANNPTWWEITDQELNTTSFVGSVPLLELGPDFSPAAPSWFRSVFQHGGSSVQRKCTTCEEKKRLQREEEEEDRNIVSRKVSADFVIARKCTSCEKEEEKKRLSRKKDDTSGVEYSLRKVEQVLHSSGEPLNKDIQRFMGERLGYDLSNVEVHNDPLAHQSSKDINAKAYTHRNHIVFASGEYRPDTDKGKKLIAHELTHVAQQTGPGVRRVIRRKHVEESKKYAGIVDYKKARKQNLDTWYSEYKFFNLFKEKKIYPGSTPIAYANHIYELQTMIETATNGKWTPSEYGILEETITKDATLIQLAVLAGLYHKDTSNTFGFDPALLERIHKYFAAFNPKAPRLVSSYFAGVSQLEMINRNDLFYISLGDRGEYVERIQLALQKLNYNLGADEKLNTQTKENEPTGIFGSGTRRAVVNFQRDSGLEGKDVDGIVGQVTLRLLDQRMGVPQYKPSSGGNGYGFQVPVTAEDMLKDKAAIKEELLRRLLKIAFPISDDKVDILLRSGWHWDIYNDITQEEVNQGYKRVVIPRADYESIIGKAEGGVADTISKKLEVQALDLLKTSKLYELNKKIDAKQVELGYAEIEAGGGLGADIRRMPTREERDEMARGRAKVEKIRGELDELVKQRDEELRKLGITLDDYEKMKSGFIETFEKFAAQTAFKMLSENEIQANIEFEHYKKTGEVQAVKKVMNDLSAKYSESEKLWWEAVSVEEGYDKGYYKNNEDYKGLNIETVATEYGAGVIDNSNPDHYYNEKNVAKKYKELERTPSSNYMAWHDKEKEIVTMLQGEVKKYPILAYPKLELRQNAGKYATMSDDDLQKKLEGIIDNNDGDKGVRQNIKAIREKIREDYKIVWKLPVVIIRAKYELGIIEGTVLDNIITDKQKQLADKSFWESIGEVVLGIGLGLLALASGPVGWLALGASIALGSYDAYKTYQDITFRRETAGTSIDPESALGTDDPSFFWFWVSLVSVGIDVLQAASLVKAIAKGAQLAEDVGQGLKNSRKVLEEELKTVEATSARGKQITKEIEEIDNALRKVNTPEFAENHKLLEPLKSNPIAVVVMNEALKDKKIVKAVLSLEKIVDKETFGTALKLYAGVGRKSIDELPELVRLIEAGGLQKNTELIKDLLSDPRIQRVLLDTQDTELFATQYAAWQTAIRKGDSISLLDFLKKGGLQPGFATDTKLVDMFGEAFAKLPNSAKNRQILRTIEPKLLDAFEAGQLPGQAQKAMEVLLNSDILAQSSRLSSAQERLLHEISIIGSAIETQFDFAKVVAVLDNPAARKALWDGASQLAGKDEYWKLILAANKNIPPPPGCLTI